MSTSQSTVFAQNTLLARRNKLLNQERSVTRLNSIIDSYLNTLFSQQQQMKTYQAEASKLFPKDSAYFCLAQELSRMFQVHCDQYSSAIGSLKHAQSHYEKFLNKNQHIELSMQKYDQYYNTYEHYHQKLEKIKNNLKKYSPDKLVRNENKYYQSVVNFEKQEYFCNEQVIEMDSYNRSVLPLLLKILATNYYELNSALGSSSSYLPKESFLAQLEDAHDRDRQEEQMQDLTFSKVTQMIHIN